MVVESLTHADDELEGGYPPETEEQNDQGDDVLALDRGDGDLDSDLDPGVQDADGGDLFQLFESGFFGSVGSDVGVGLLDSEKDLDEPYARIEEFVYTPLSPLSDPRKRRRTKHRPEVPPTISIGPEDYEEGNERSAFMFTFERMRACFLKSTSPENRDEAIRWIFTADKEDINFDLCCRVLGARAEILRLRLQYQFYLSWTTFPEAFAFNVAQLPDLLGGEILYRTGDEGYEIALTTWCWPGIQAKRLWDSLSHRFSEDRYKRAMEQLEERGVLGLHGNNYYLIGRNPSAFGPTARQTFRWSDLWK